MLNPILSFSATRRMRSFKTLLIIGAYLLVMAGTAILIMSRLFSAGANIYALRTGVTCYQVLIIVQFILIILIAPAMTSGAIAGERERQTLELLLVTNTRSFRIVWGKAMESFALLALLIVCGFPVMCLTRIAGAVTLLQILSGELFLLVMAFAAVSVGVLSSALAKSTVGSTVFSYLTLLAIGLLTSIPLIAEPGENLTSLIYDENALAALKSPEALGMLSPVLFLNPAYALMALLQGQTGMLTSMVALICCGAITLLALLLILIAAFVLRRNGLKPAKRTKN